VPAPVRRVPSHAVGFFYVCPQRPRDEGRADAGDQQDHGHSSTQVTEVYVSVSKDVTVKAMEEVFGDG
jgi:hypothetical protein